MSALDTVREFAGRQIGPLPVWGWTIAGVGGVALGRIVSRTVGTGAEVAGADVAGTIGVGTRQSIAGAGGAIGLPTSAAPIAATGPERPATNGEWRSRAFEALRAAGYGALVVDTALGRYLDGDQLTADEASIIDAALSAVGIPPNPPTPRFVLEVETEPVPAPQPVAPVAPVTPAPVTPAPVAPVRPVIAQAPADPVPRTDPAESVVREAFADVLGRAPDPEGLAYWIGQVRGGLSVEALRRELDASRERQQMLSTPIAPPATTAPEALPVAAPAPAARSHTVARGDTLTAIGRRYGVSWQSIAAANSLANPNLIRPGQVLTIP